MRIRKDIHTNISVLLRKRTHADFYWFVFDFLTGNVLSLRNSLNLSPDTTEVSQEKLLSLIAERLIDSNSNIDVKNNNLQSRTLLILSLSLCKLK